MITVVGVSGSAVAPAGCADLAAADVVVGSERLLAALGPRVATVTITGDLAPVLDAIAEAVAKGQRVCVLAAGDPGWFGILRAVAARFDDLRVIPAPSSVSEAFARLRMPWDDATVVSAHGRSLGDAAGAVARAPKAAVLVSPESPPEALGAALVALGATHEHVAVCSHLGLPDESVTVTDLDGLATGGWDPLSVVVLWSGTGIGATKTLAWGRPEAVYAHRASMVTKSEVRAVVVGLLALPGPSAPPPVLWDVGAGSGSVGIESAQLAPWIETVAVERDAEGAAMCRANAAAAGVALQVVNGVAPACLAALPDPDRVFVGGGGLEVLRAARGRLKPGGVIVATFAAMDRAAAAADLLGNLTQIAASRGRLLPDGGWRLEATNPVFVTWGGGA